MGLARWGYVVGRVVVTNGRRSMLGHGLRTSLALDRFGLSFGSYSGPRCGECIPESSCRTYSGSSSCQLASDSSQRTDFGYRSVPEEEKAGLVAGVFKSVADKYDLMNDLMSGGLHRLWKDRLVSELRPFPGMRHLDAAGGTGDVSFRLLKAIRDVERNVVRVAQQPSTDTGTERISDEDAVTKVVVSDINPAMLEVGKRRAKERGFGDAKELDWLEADAESLPLEDGSFDSFTIAFGIRNCTHIDKVVSEAYRVLRKGGRFLCLEFSQVEAVPLRKLYDVYSFAVIPRIGELVAGDRESYRYLVESIRRFPNQRRFAQMIVDAGFQRVQYENLTGGVVAIHSGFKL